MGLRIALEPRLLLGREGDDYVGICSLQITDDSHHTAIAERSVGDEVDLVMLFGLHKMGDSRGEIGIVSESIDELLPLSGNLDGDVRMVLLSGHQPTVSTCVWQVDLEAMTVPVGGCGVFGSGQNNRRHERENQGRR